MQLRINEEAVNDLAGIKEYISLDSEQNAIAVVTEILNCIDNLPRFPDSGMKLENHTKRKNNYRFKVVKPYLIFYKIENETVRVYRIIHAGMDYINLLGL